jgi:hypothetical protein
MIDNINVLFREPVVRRTFIFLIIILVLFAALTAWKWQLLPPQIPLFYSQPRSEEQLGSPLQLLLLPAGAVLICMINTMLAVWLIKKERLASLVLILAGGFSALLLFTTFVKILFLIT